METTEGLGELGPLTKGRAKGGGIRGKQTEFGLRQVEFESLVGPPQGEVPEAVRENSLGSSKRSRLDVEIENPYREAES